MHNSEPLGLRFESAQDSLDYARNLVEDGNNWLAAHDLDVAKRYEREEVELVLECGVLNCLGERSNYELSFLAVPDGALRTLEKSCRRELARGLNGTGAHRGHNGVLISDSYPIQSVEKVIRSFVWLKLSDERKDFIGDILAESPCRFFKFNFALVDGKVCISRISLASSNGDLEPGAIKGSAQIHC